MLHGFTLYPLAIIWTMMAMLTVETLTVEMMMLSGMLMAELNIIMKTSRRMRKLAKASQDAMWNPSRMRNQTWQWPTERGRTSHKLNKFGTEYILLNSSPKFVQFIVTSSLTSNHPSQTLIHISVFKFNDFVQNPT